MLTNDFVSLCSWSHKQKKSCLYTCEACSRSATGLGVGNMAWRSFQKRSWFSSDPWQREGSSSSATYFRSSQWMELTGPTGKVTAPRVVGCTVCCLTRRQIAWTEASCLTSQSQMMVTQLHVAFSLRMTCNTYYATHFGNSVTTTCRRIN